MDEFLEDTNGLREIKPPAFNQRGFKPTSQTCPTCGGGMARGPVVSIYSWFR